MQVFFKTKADIESYLSQLKLIQCPFCGANETLIRHGTTRRYESPEESRIRLWRVRCKRSVRRNGCTRTWGIRLGETMLRCFFTARELWAFIQELERASSIKSAWERCGIGLSLDTGYRLYKRFILCQSLLRTSLCSRSPPPKKSAGSPLFQVFKHLKEVFGDACGVRAYQECFQKDFLAIS